MATKEFFNSLEIHLRLPAMGTGTALLLTVTILIVAYVYQVSQAQPDLSHIPIVAPELSETARKELYAKDSMTILRRGYQDFNLQGKPFQVPTTMGNRVILGLKHLEEVRAKPDSVVGNLEPVFEAVQDKYTHIGAPDDTVVHVIKTDLSTKVGKLTETLAAEIDECFQRYLPPCTDWTAVTIFENMLMIVAVVSARLFLGEELAHDQEWIRNSIDYTMTLMNAAHDIQRTRPILRPFVYQQLDSVKKHKAAQKLTFDKVKPLIQKRREAMKEPEAKQYFDMTQWMLNERVKKGYEDSNYDYLAQAQLQLSFASIHTTSMALTHMIYDLCANPELQKVIRDELDHELALNGGYRGEILKKLEKCDSVMKESQRHNPVGLTIVDRYIKKGFSLSDGTYLPKGIVVSGNTYQITHDPAILQSETDPNIFDGLRYYNMRKTLMKTDSESKEVAGKHQFVSISQASLMFGYGKHACPGRFFASNELKVIIVKLLEQFEIKYPAHVKERYKNSTFEMSIFPDFKGEVFLRRVQRK